MLAEEPAARGSARQVAKELERLLEFNRAALAAPWAANASRVSTEKGEVPSSVDWVRSGGLLGLEAAAIEPAA